MRITDLTPVISLAGSSTYPSPGTPSTGLPAPPRNVDFGHIMPNPSIPSLYLEIRRDGHTDHLVIEPETLEWVQSTEGADMLKFTVPDPEYVLIDHDMLQEDFKTEVRFRYGYNSRMSDMGIMRFFRQRPTFPENDIVRTTVVCYDLSVFLNFEIPGRTLRGAETVTLKDVVLADVAEINALYDVNLKVEFDGYDYGNKYYRVVRPHGPVIEHLAYIRQVAAADGGGDETLAEIYVENDTLHFHPPRRRMDPIGAFAYFSEHPGSRLLSFEPKVDLGYRRKKARVVDIDPDTGATESAESDGRGGERRTVNTSTRIDAAGGEVVEGAVKPGDAPSDSEPRRTIKKYTVRGDEGDNLIGIIEQFPGANLQEFLEANPTVFENYPEHFELVPGQVLDVPVPDEDSSAVTTMEAEALVKATYLDIESRALNADAVILGDPRMRAGYPADFFNVGKKWSGRWYIRECVHEYNSSTGYRVGLNLTREGPGYGDWSEEDLAGATQNVEPLEPKDAADQRPATEIDAGRGAVREQVIGRRGGG